MKYSNMFSAGLRDRTAQDLWKGEVGGRFVIIHSIPNGLIKLTELIDIPPTRRIGSQVNQVPRRGMRQAKVITVQGDTVRQFLLATVLAIAPYRTAATSELDPDLMFTPRNQFYRQKCSPSKNSNHLKP